MSRQTLPSARLQTLSELRPTVLRVTHARGITNVRVFGSFARGDQRSHSDLDLLVELPDGATLIDLSGLKIDLEEAVGRKVDVLTEGGISSYLRDRILSDARPL